MQTLFGLPAEPLAGESALTIGVFDGVHRGHAALIGRAVERARTTECLAGVITFDPHPVEVLAPHVPVRYLSSLSGRLGRLASLGVDYVAVLPFTREMSQTTARDFMDPVVRLLRLRHLVIGHDFTLGHGRQGNESFLRALGREWGFEVEAIEPVRTGGAIASSTRIRQLLSAGQLLAAASMLGYTYAIEATLGADGSLHVPANRQLLPDGHYQCHMCASELRVPCAVESRNGVLRTRWGGLDPGPVALSFEKDVTTQAEGFEEVEHTADVALRVTAATFPELLRQAALGMFALMQRAAPETSEGTVQMGAQGADREMLLVNWLSELLYQHEVRQTVFTDFTDVTVGDGYMTAQVLGLPTKEVRKAIKAVTFSDLRIVERDGFLETTIVFDI